ncbi:MAG: cytidine/deoxycytidylate deaminase family protein [Patescibacteria group bacterium]|nr:MAG: cytidine/deoxycytidylate deaminase family protein [Patescibacteria group bacterium]
MTSLQRPSWDDYFMGIAKIVATRGTCNRLQVGAVLVKDRRIVATGYNGAPPGMPHCDGPAGHLMEENHCIRTVHAEENCVLQAAVMGGNGTVGSTLYTTHSPCYHCFKALAGAGVKRIVAGAEYRSPAVVAALPEAGITLDSYQPSREWTERLAHAFTAPLENYVSKA